MNRIKLIQRIVAVATTSIAIVGMAGQVAQADKPAFLLQMRCVTTMGDWGAENEEVSVGRQLFTSVMRMLDGNARYPSSITCRIRPAGSKPKFKTLRLAFGIKDNVQPGEVTVSVYVDGNQAASRSVTSGEKALLLVDVSKASSLALEATCSKNCPYEVHFFQALLEPLPSQKSPGTRK